MKVAKIGWEKENFCLSVVLLDRKTRTAMGLPEGSIVKVKRADGIGGETYAMVFMQFKDLVGKGITVSTILVKALGLTEGMEVEISPYLVRNADGRLPFNRLSEYLED